MRPSPNPANTSAPGQREVPQQPADHSQREAIDSPALADRVSAARRPCPECGGHLEWSARKQALTCPYCGTIAPWQVAAHDPDGAVASSDGGLASANREHDLEAALRDRPICAIGVGIGAR